MYTNTTTTQQRPLKFPWCQSRLPWHGGGALTPALGRQQEVMQSEITLHCHVTPLTFDLVAVGGKQLSSCATRWAAVSLLHGAILSFSSVFSQCKRRVRTFPWSDRHRSKAILLQSIEFRIQLEVKEHLKERKKQTLEKVLFILRRG